MPDNTLADRVEAADGPSLYSWWHNPSWAQEGGENFDGNWMPDCNGKLDYDPMLIRLSCRVWRDGGYHASVYFGDNQIATSGLVGSKDVQTARTECEKWCLEQTEWLRGVIAAALRAKDRNDG